MELRPVWRVPTRSELLLCLLLCPFSFSFSFFLFHLLYSSLFSFHASLSLFSSYFTSFLSCFLSDFSAFTPAVLFSSFLSSCSSVSFLTPPLSLLLSCVQLLLPFPLFISLNVSAPPFYAFSSPEDKDVFKVFSVSVVLNL